MSDVKSNDGGSIASSYVDHVIKKGYLNKKGSGHLGVGTGWKKRFFCLTEKGLDYYEDVTLSNKKGTIDLQSITEIKSNEKKIELQDKKGRLWQLEAADELEAQNWHQVIQWQIHGKVLHEGFMTKRGAKIKSWKRRYFILRDTKILDYYEDDSQKKLLGKIELMKIRLISRGTRKEFGKDYIMLVSTKPRNWVFSCNDESDLENWIGHLERAVPGAKRLITTKEGGLFILDGTTTNWVSRYFALCRGWLFIFETEILCETFKGMVFFVEEMFQDAFKNYVKASVDLRVASIKVVTCDESKHPYGLDICTNTMNIHLACPTKDKRDSWFFSFAPICKEVQNSDGDTDVKQSMANGTTESERTSSTKEIAKKEPLDQGGQM